MNPVKWSLKYPQVTVVVTLMLFATGVYALLKMPRREDPKITIRQGLVAAIYPGATAEQVEDQVTRKIEERLFRFEEVRKDKTYSTSRPNMVIVNVRLEDRVRDTDKFWARLRHDMNELKVRELPPSVSGPMVNSDFGDTVAVLLAVSGTHYGYRELKDYVERIEDELRTVRAVSKLKRYGEQKEQIYITSSLERLSQYATDPARVIRALQTRNIVPYAGSIDLDRQRVPLNASGLFQTEDEIRRVMVDVSQTGQPVYIGDLASVERRYQDPDNLTRLNGEPCLMLSVEMQEGNNVVDFGKEVRTKIDTVKAGLPPDLKIDLIADQPKVVEERISHFIREFGIAIAAVILVTMVLLPFRVAIIAALAIPVTVSVTFGIMDAIGIELHQVSISALIVVLGMVVDDAIVIADNYVELLDRKVSREDAAWRSATELAVPVLTATVTIIASFLPLLMLSGSVGEFISALPITVAVALGSSFVVAMLLTPLLCRFFIHTGLHSGDGERKKKFSVLDLMQRGYMSTIKLAMKWKLVAVAVGVLAFAGGIVLLRFVSEQFFPSAERNQFVADVWLPEGTRIETTDAVLRRIEGVLAKDALVASYATFVGQSAPRFYYNVNPEDPAPNYGQLLVNTRSEEKTPAMVSELRKRLAEVAPEAHVIVKELQQGEIVHSPVEVRISGDDLGTIQSIGEHVKQILRDTKGSIFVEDNFREYAMQVKLDVDNEVANRLGLTTSSIAAQLAGGFQGAPATTFWEGDRAVDVLLRLDPNQRRSFDNIRDTYLTSQLTRARVPVREVAGLEPQWEPGRIVRRNGVRTMTVGSFFQHGYLASQVLNAARPKIDALPLPPGYRIKYGGEIESQQDTFREMVRAMNVSLVAIFLVLLFQFRSLSDPWIVMISIPLSLLGAALGLLITNNPFGFTAFMGVVSLSGIVVRNAIILVDYIRERRKEGVSLEQAALEAGERRLRPIFLTTMAAAIGVIPMIASGSSLWSPLASVIAIGLLCSMVFTLVVVPVVYVMVHRKSALKGAVVMLVAGLVLASAPARAETRRMTIEEAVDTALKGNPLLKLARLKVKEQQGKQQAARSLFFPQVSNESNLLRLGEQQTIPIPMGMMGVYPGTGPIPGRDINVPLGNKTEFFAFTTFGQPLTQLLKIRQGYRVSQMDTAIASTEVTKAEIEVALKVHEAFFGLLIAREMKQSAELRVAAAEEQLRDARNAVEAGTTLEVSAIGRRAALLEARHGLLSVENQISDVALEFNDLVGLPLAMEVDPVTPAPVETLTVTLADSVTAAQSASPEVRAAEQTEVKARAALTAAWREYIPNISAFGQYIYQSGVPLLAQNNGIAGFKMDWNIVDFGKRRGVVHEREALVEQAAENLRRVRSRVAIEVEKSFRKLDRSQKMVDVAREAVELRRESERLASDQVLAGVANTSAKLEASAARARSEAELFQAELGYRMARAEFDRALGRVPR